MKVLIAATLLLMSCAPVSSTPSPTPTVGAAAPTSTQATPSPTATVAAGLSRYVSTELGYSVDLPAGWRRATCSPGILTTSPLSASEMFVAVPEAEEVIRGGVRFVGVRVSESNGLTPLAWLEQNASKPDGARFEAATLNGRTGARGFIETTGSAFGVAFAARGRIYSIVWTYFGSSDPEPE